MAVVTAALVKQLRDQTGAGMMDCKAALTETAGDFEAVARLRGVESGSPSGYAEAFHARKLLLNPELQS